MNKAKTIWLIFWILAISAYASVGAFTEILQRQMVIGFLWGWMLMTIFGWLPRIEVDD